MAGILSRVPHVDLVDETYLAVPPAVVAAAVHDPARWRRWWPDLDLVVFMDREQRGVRWSVTGALVGSSEIWVEPVGDGSLVHYYLRADPTVAGRPREPSAPHRDPLRAARAAAKVRTRRALAWKRHANALKDELERGRRPGTPAVKETGSAAEA